MGNAAADTKITELTEATSAAGTDIVPIVVDPGSSPVTKKITVTNILSGRVKVTTGTSDPAASCTAGTEVFYDTTNKNWWLCSATNTWSKTFSVGADGSYRVTMQNNSAISPTGSSDELYFEANIFKVNQNGTESSVPIGPTAGQITFSGPTQARTITIPDADTTMAGVATTQTLTNKTLTTPVITSLEVLIDCNGSADPYAYCTSANASTLTAAHTSRTIINSYGRGEAQTVTLPAAATGMTFIAMVGTKHNSAWKIQRAGSDTITWSSGGTDTTGKTYFQETNQEVGSRVSCITYKTGASAWTWLCGSVTGTWVTD